MSSPSLTAPVTAIASRPAAAARDRIVALIAEYFLPRNPSLVPGARSPILSSLASWGKCYFGVSANGYHADPVAEAYLVASTLLTRLRAPGLDGSRASMAAGLPIVCVLMLLWSVFLPVLVRVDVIQPEYWLIPVLLMAAELSSGSLEAVGRVTMAAFLYAWLLAEGQSVFARRAWPIVSTGLFTLVAVLSFAGFRVP